VGGGRLFQRALLPSTVKGVYEIVPHIHLSYWHPAWHYPGSRVLSMGRTSSATSCLRSLSNSNKPAHCMSQAAVAPACDHTACVFAEVPGGAST
jgi:hypothetical protein